MASHDLAYRPSINSMSRVESGRCLRIAIQYYTELGKLSMAARNIKVRTRKPDEAAKQLPSACDMLNSAVLIRSDKTDVVEPRRWLAERGLVALA